MEKKIKNILFKSFLVVVLAFLGCTFSDKVLANNINEAGNEGDISFYSPEISKEKEPISKEIVNTIKNSLPQTGEEQLVWISVVGGIIIILVVLLILRKKREEPEDE